jgi:leucyl-tRNA synthetase
MDRFHFNTAVSGVMQMVNALYEYREAAGASLAAPEPLEAVDLLTRLLAPMAPHVAEGAWERLGHDQSIFLAGWPTVDAAALQSDVVSLVIQVNGKVRSKIAVPAGAARSDIESAALADPQVRKHSEGKQVRQVIHVAGRLVNIVVG